MFTPRVPRREGGPWGRAGAGYDLGTWPRVCSSVCSAFPGPWLFMEGPCILAGDVGLTLSPKASSPSKRWSHGKLPEVDGQTTWQGLGTRHCIQQVLSICWISGLANLASLSTWECALQAYVWAPAGGPGRLGRPQPPLLTPCVGSWQHEGAPRGRGFHNRPSSHMREDTTASSQSSHARC